MPEFFDPYEGRKKKKRKRPPPELSPDMLRDAARRYLQRYWPSVFQLRRVLMRRVDKSIGWHSAPEAREADRERGAAMVEDLLQHYVTEGVLDDARFTRSWVGDLHRRGISRRGIRAKMRDKGVSGDLVEAALAELAEDVPEPELVRACAYVRRRRLGPARPEGRRPRDEEGRRARREKDLAAVCRAGFSFGVAQQVIDAEDLDALMARADGGAGSTW